MGADLILQWAPAPPTLTFDMMNELIRAVPGLSTEDLDHAVQSAHGLDVEEMYGGDEDEARKAIVSAIILLWEDNSRDRFHVPEGVLGGSPCFISGGTSWGDSFEGMSDIALVDAAGLLDRFKQREVIR